MENTEIWVCSVVKAVQVLNTNTCAVGVCFILTSSCLESHSEKWLGIFLLGHRNRCFISAVARFGGKEHLEG